MKVLLRSWLLIGLALVFLTNYQKVKASPQATQCTGYACVYSGSITCPDGYMFPAPGRNGNCNGVTCQNGFAQGCPPGCECFQGYGCEYGTIEVVSVVSSPTNCTGQPTPECPLPISQWNDTACQ